MFSKTFSPPIKSLWNKLVQPRQFAPSLFSFPLLRLRCTCSAVSAPPVAAMTKRKQVRQACGNCQRACKKCDEVRPCQRCVKLGCQSSCSDTLRKRDLKHVLASEGISLTSPPRQSGKLAIPAPVPIVKAPIANLNTLALVCSDEFEKCADKTDDLIASDDTLSRIHMHRMLSNSTPLPRKPLTPPPSPFPDMVLANMDIGQAKD